MQLTPRPARGGAGGGVRRRCGARAGPGGRARAARARAPAGLAARAAAARTTRIHRNHNTDLITKKGVKAFATFFKRTKTHLLPGPCSGAAALGLWGMGRAGGL